MKMVKKSSLCDRRMRYSQLFLNVLTLRRSKNLLSRNFVKNYFFYRFFLKTFKKNKNLFLIRSLFLVKNNKILINPIFSFKKKFLNTHSNYSEFLKKTNYNSLFLSKKSLKCLNLNQNFGVNYYLMNNKPINNNMLSIFNSDEFKDVIKIKFILNNCIDFTSNDYLNFFFNYNIHVVNILEFYKIVILLNLNNS